jgi:hypothetical protein
MDFDEKPPCADVTAWARGEVRDEGRPHLHEQCLQLLVLRARNQCLVDGVQHLLVICHATIDAIRASLMPWADQARRILTTYPLPLARGGP